MNITSAKKIAFRCDASLDIGFGHVMRCMALANALKKNNHIIAFIVQAETLAMLPQIAEQDFFVTDGFKDTDHYDLLVIDGYQFDIQYETSLRRFTDAILVIDDIPNRKHDCDFLLDYTYLRKSAEYKTLVPPHCVCLCGLDYLILRDEFYQKRQNATLPRSYTKVHNLLISFGSTNPDHIVERCLQAVAPITSVVLNIDVIIGAWDTKDISFLKTNIDTLTHHSVSVHSNISNISDHMMKADISIGAAGTTSWERCYLGLPSIVIELADNQADINKKLDQAGVIVSLGKLQEVTEKSISTCLESLLHNANLLTDMSNKAITLCKGNGTKAIIESLFHDK